MKPRFLTDLAPIKNGNDPLAEDWMWVRGHMGNFAATRTGVRQNIF